LCRLLCVAETTRKLTGQTDGVEIIMALRKGAGVSSKTRQPASVVKQNDRLEHLNRQLGLGVENSFLW